MSLSLANSRHLLYTRYSSLQHRGIASPKSVHQPRIRHICALASSSNGGQFRDGAFVAAAASDMQTMSGPSLAISPDSVKEASPPSWVSIAERRIERAIFDFRFLTLMAIAGSLVGSLLCFLKGTGYICESFVAYFKMCVNGMHTGKVILRLVEAVDVYLMGTVMLIFGMGLFGLFIANEPVEGQHDRALKNTTLFGMFALSSRPRWMRITNLDTLKTKLGHVIVMILLVKLFEKSKTVHIASSVDLLSYAFSIFLSSVSLYVLHRLHAP